MIANLLLVSTTIYEAYMEKRIRFEIILKRETE